MTDARGATAEWTFPNRATPPGSSAYYSVRFAPAAQRDALAGLFGWRGEVRGVLVRVTDVGVARLKLDWWRAEAERLAAGAPRHPLGQVILAASADGAAGAAPGQRVAPPPPLAPLLELIDATEAVLRRQPIADDAAWLAARDADRGALAQLLAHTSGVGDPRLLAAARRAGGWCAAVRALRDAGRHLRDGRVVLPAARLAAAGLTGEALAFPAGRARLPALLLPLAERLDSERPPAAGLPTVLRAQVRIHAALLAELRACALAVAEQRIGLTPLRKLWLAWRA